MSGREEPVSSYSPITTTADGRVSVVLADDHPGLADPVYRVRRDELAALALSWSPGQPLPEPDYTDEEHRVWREVSQALAGRHRLHATRAFLDCAASLGLPVDHVPQLAEVGRRLRPLTGFDYAPVAGLAPLREFYGAFAGGTFWSTQYLRHPSAPLYTPEPDLVHEVIGHANQLADPRVAAMYRRVGAAVERTQGEVALRALSKVFWFAVEFGVVFEGGEPKAFGAGLLSSVGELDAFTRADIRPADWAEMAGAAYDITRFQPVLYSWRSDTELIDSFSGLLDGWDDEAATRLLSAPSRVTA